MARSKTRFVINANVGVRELFSVGESSQGDLLIVHKDGRAHQELDGTVSEIAVDRTSVHLSPKSEGTTFAHTLELTCGKLISTSAFVHASGNYLIWVSRAATPNNPAFGFTEANPGKKDRVISLGNYDSELASLTYAIVVGGPNFEFPTAPSIFRLEVARFREFSIAVYYSFLSTPVFETYSVIRSLTSKPITERGAEPGQIGHGVPTIPPYLLLVRLAHLFGTLGARTLNHINRRLPPHLQAGEWQLRLRAFLPNPLTTFEEFDVELDKGRVNFLPIDSDVQFGP